jgi:hypothetical protein
VAHLTNESAPERMDAGGKRLQVLDNFVATKIELAERWR